MISQGCEISQTEEQIFLKELLERNVDFIISYRYRHLIKKEVINHFPGKIINLHISYLPWNRGADPNLWSYFENTPKGVTIHLVDVGLDTGDIVVQQLIDDNFEDTLYTSYQRLSEAIENLIILTWHSIIRGEIKPVPQNLSEGTAHRSRDKQTYESLLTDGWHTPVKHLIGKALKKGDDIDV
ncbi:formyltransferase family protein [Paenibacillus ferrarius]|uniref:formyltransferase family protein n=1 Tax=Paenibacillus ferrarius TaxID=1469647 RepID=UPI00244AD744|nr:formyltransferase family protein [Paenibacillus ferrarius]